MLSYAAIFAGGFDFRVLQAMTELDDERLLDALDEGLASGLIRPIEGRGERYDFGHAIVRQVLAADWSPSRLIRLHRRLAEALERVYAGREIEVAAELAIQYHESAALPGGEKGIDYALAAAAQARASAAREQAVGFLRIARDLAALSDQGVPATILARLTLAEAESLYLDDARRTVEQAMTAFIAAGTSPEEIATFLAVVAAALEDGGAPVADWQPLVERGLALLEAQPGAARGLTWARLKLTLKAFAPIARGTINASRWLGSDPTAIAIARAGGEEDFARTIQPFDIRSPEETRALLLRARDWTNPAPRIRVLIMAGADRLYYHGQVREAIAVFDELLETSERVGSISGQAEALIRLAIAQTTLGEFERAQGTAQRARATVGRLGAGHHLQASVAWIAAFLADNLEGEWRELADFWTAFAADPRAGENGLVVDDAALAAYAHARAGNVAESRRLLQALTPLLEHLAPTEWLVNGAVALAAATLWWLEASDLAPTYRVLARVPRRRRARRLPRNVERPDRGPDGGLDRSARRSRRTLRPRPACRCHQRSPPAASDGRLRRGAGATAPGRRRPGTGRGADRRGRDRVHLARHERLGRTGADTSGAFPPLR